MCRLKRQVMPRVESSCCVSGVRGAGVIEPRLGELEYSIDRVGGDYRSFETTPDPQGKPCADACQAETRCRAWTYRRPGYGTTGSALLPQRDDQAAAPPALLYFGGGAVAPLVALHAPLAEDARAGLQMPVNRRSKRRDDFVAVVRDRAAWLANNALDAQ